MADNADAEKLILEEDSQIFKDTIGSHVSNLIRKYTTDYYGEVNRGTLEIIDGTLKIEKKNITCIGSLYEYNRKLFSAFMCYSLNEKCNKYDNDNENNYCGTEINNATNNNDIKNNIKPKNIVLWRCTNRDIHDSGDLITIKCWMSTTTRQDIAYSFATSYNLETVSTNNNNNSSSISSSINGSANNNNASSINAPTNENCSRSKSSITNSSSQKFSRSKSSITNSSTIFSTNNKLSPSNSSIRNSSSSKSSNTKLSPNNNSVIIYKINVPYKYKKYLMPIQAISCAPGECEVLLPVGSTLKKVKKVKKVNNVNKQDQYDICEYNLEKFTKDNMNKILKQFEQVQSAGKPKPKPTPKPVKISILGRSRSISIIKKSRKKRSIQHRWLIT
jgi:hypothetical protein